jgi:large subunit ribosomal protein L25
MAQPIALVVEPRNVVGKKVKKLRRDGIIPANIFGQGVKSTSIQVNLKDFAKVYNQVGETGLVELSLKDAKHPVLVHQIQKEPRTDAPLHVDFHQVNLKEKTTAHVPVVLVGEAPIEKSKEGIILQSMNEIEIEALPTDIPHNIEVDITSLTEVGQAVQVKDLKVDSSKVEIKADGEATVLSVQTAEIKEEVVEEAPAEVEVIGEKAEGEKAEGEEASEGETAEGAEAPADAGGDNKPQE